MSGTLLGMVIVVAVVVLACIGGAAVYNRLVTLRQRYLNAFAQIDVQLKRRHDLIPNLVEAVKGYMAHERQTLEAVIAARNVAAGAVATAAADPRNAAAIASAAGAENALVGALAQFRVVSEAYPNLKADRGVTQLMEELTSTENRVGFARQAYNDAVMEYNAARLRFPAITIAGPMGFGDAALFQIDDPNERAAVQVKM
jgi:LemA protein